MKVLVLGANGRTGRKFMAVALEAGHSLTALVRSGDKLADVRHERLTVRVGSACCEATLAPLMSGHDAVVSTLGPRWPSSSAAAVYPDSARAIIAAMEAGAVRRLLVTSSGLLFPDDSRVTKALRWMVPAVVDGARRMEAVIVASGLDWTIARTSFLTNEDSTELRLGREELPNKARAVPRAAVAHFLLQELERPQHLRSVVGLCS